MYSYSLQFSENRTFLAAARAAMCCISLLKKMHCFFLIAPRLVVGAIYKHLNEMMKLPWTAELKAHTIHVDDLVRATYHLCMKGKPGEV